MVKKFKNAFLAVIVILFASGLIFRSSATVSAAKDALALCAISIIPALFPFFVLTSMITGLGWSSALGRLFEPLIRPLFHLRGIASAPLISGLIGGYPVGVKTAVSLYETGECSKDECERMLSFCSNTGPGFFIGIIGIGIFSSAAVGIYLYICHALSAIITGIILRPKSLPSAHGKITFKPKTDSVSKVFISSVQGSVSAILNVCGFVILFAVIICLADFADAAKFLSDFISAVALGNINSDILKAVIEGMVELTSGVFQLGCLFADARVLYTALSFITAFGGLSIHAQALSFISPAGLSAKRYFMGKSIHSVISASAAWLLYSLAPKAVIQSSVTASVRFSDAFAGFSRSSVIFSIILWLIFLIFAYRTAKKDGNLH